MYSFLLWSLRVIMTKADREEGDKKGEDERWENPEDTHVKTSPFLESIISQFWSLFKGENFDPLHKRNVSGRQRHYLSWPYFTVLNFCPCVFFSSPNPKMWMLQPGICICILHKSCSSLEYVLVISISRAPVWNVYL